MSRKHSSTSLPASQLDHIEQSKVKFGEFLDNSLPIVSSKELSNSTSVLLNQTVRRMVRSFTEPSNITDDSQTQESIRKYFKDKNAITIPSLHNVQSLLFLSLFVDETRSGAGNKLMTAVRMAFSLHLNRPPDQLDEDRSPAVNYLWWTLVSKDIWLYIFSGVPPVITYMGFNVPKPERAPTFFSALIGISEVLRMLIRRNSIGDYARYDTAMDALCAWERDFFVEVYPPVSPDAHSHPFDGPAFLRLLHSVVLSLFALQDPFFRVRYYTIHQQGRSDAAADMVMAGNPVGRQGFNSSPPPTDASYFGYPNGDIYEVLLRTLSLHMTHPVLFNRWGYLQRFAEIAVLAILRLTFGFVPAQVIVFTEENYVIANWKGICMIEEERWSKILSLVGEDRGWEVVLDLCKDVVEEDEETDSGDGDN
ncbi:hypothetical protein H072_10435 [Dactylellina haptotyla CBS 200.50]|uniref:Xylanolytic transcriptional activator regulatory domain-containing protein n=1 Tax=Dactylellina haptotyla (strain CBS 200.50) TaxID=1284197 RepID=S8BLB5_DACHA|nr:hypothetical protein H072_10435 [Dactylellina haptotyla CBS 200.50]